MALAKIQGAQRDFSAGELNVSMKRADENPLMKTGARQLSNWRVLNSGSIKNRPGRTALFLEKGRVEKVLMSAGNFFYIAFGNGYLSVYNAVGHQVFTSTKKGDGTTTIPWLTATVKNIVYAIPSGAQKSIYIFYGDDAPVNVPQILTWDGVSQTSTWMLATFAETIGAGGQKRTVFYRISPPNITLEPSGTGGVVTITFSNSVLVSGMIGTRIRFAQRQLQILTVSSGTVGTATVIEPLPPSENLSFSSAAGSINIGDVVTGDITGAVGIITQTSSQQTVQMVGGTSADYHVGDAVTGGTSGATGIVLSSSPPAGGGGGIVVISLSTTTAFIVGEVITGPHGADTSATATGADVVVQLIPRSGNLISYFAGTEYVVGPSGYGVLSGTSIGVPQAVSAWDQEVMNLYFGYPTSGFYDQNRLGLCNFPSVPSGIGWSALGLNADFYIDAQPDNAIFELVPGKSQVYYVQAGMESSEFVFCDNAVYYIPITPTNPLKPGSVGFNLLSEQGCLPNVQPRTAGQSIMFARAGGADIGAVQAPGAYYRPYVVDGISDLHSHLFTSSSIIGLAVQNASSQFEEMYAFVLLANGNMVMGRYGLRQGLLDAGPEGKPKIGWLPWNGAGFTSWVAALGSDVTFTSNYTPNGIGAVGVVEAMDDTQYLDSAMLYNAAPAAFTPPGGKGPLYWLAGGTVELMDNSTRMMGTYTIDANGFIVPQFNGGEDLTSVALVAGQTWTAIVEPFIPDAPPGQALHQRMFKRRVSRMMVYVRNSTGFLMARLFSGPITPTSPALGTVMNTHRVTTWNQGDDPTQSPPLREEVQRWRPLGRAFDPRVAVIKDLPGPLEIAEIGSEATI